MEGMHTVDVGMLMLPILVEMMIAIADSAGVKYRKAWKAWRMKEAQSLIELLVI